MSKNNKIIYWISTSWLVLGMFSTGIVQLMHLKEEMEKMAHLGYPSYFFCIIGVWKILGAIAVLVPKFPLIKEWTYAGFFFVMSGAIISHIASNSAVNEILPSVLLLTLTAISWYFRPEERKLLTNK